ncbi:MAG: hypothetical protein ACE5F1_09125, partial [Planctomycetota bacterium]
KKKTVKRKAARKKKTVKRKAARKKKTVKRKAARKKKTAQRRQTSKQPTARRPAPLAVPPGVAERYLALWHEGKLDEARELGKELAARQSRTVRSLAGSCPDVVLAVPKSPGNLEHRGPGTVGELPVLGLRVGGLDPLPKAEHVAALGTLLELCVEANDIWLGGVLPYLPSLQKLDLSCSEITGTAVALAAALPSLTSLDLSHTELADGDLAALAQATRLESLSLTNTAVTDQGLEHLRPLEALGWLNMKGTAVSAAGARRVREWAPGCVVDVDPGAPAEELPASAPASAGLAPSVPIVSGAIRPGTTKVHLDYQGLVLFFFDESRQGRIGGTGCEILTTFGENSLEDPRLLGLFDDRSLVLYVLDADRDVDLQVVVGAELSEQELRTGYWLPPEQAALSLPSGRLCIHGYESLPFRGHASDGGSVVEVAPGDYLLTLHRKAWDEAEAVGSDWLGVADNGGGGTEVSVGQRTDEVLVLTPLGEDRQEDTGGVLFPRLS